MNEEQFEAMMVDTVITLKLSEIGAKEDKREYDVDIDGDLICHVWATKPTEINYIDVTICKNIEGEYHAKFG